MLSFSDPSENLILKVGLVPTSSGNYVSMSEVLIVVSGNLELR